MNLQRKLKRVPGMTKRTVNEVAARELQMRADAPVNNWLGDLSQCSDEELHNYAKVLKVFTMAYEESPGTSEGFKQRIVELLKNEPV